MSPSRSDLKGLCKTRFLHDLVHSLNAGCFRPPGKRKPVAQWHSGTTRRDFVLVVLAAMSPAFIVIRNAWAQQLCPSIPFPAPLNTNATTDVGSDAFPQLTTDGQGTWLAVWNSNDDLGGTIGNDADIFLARSIDDGATWSDPIPLNANAGINSGLDLAAQLTTDHNGTWIAVWRSTDSLGGTVGTDFDVFFARSTDDGATWSDPRPLNNNAGMDSEHDFNAQLTTDGMGTWLVVWNSPTNLGGTIGTDFDIFFARSTNDGVTWTDPAPLNTNATTDGGEDLRPQLATDGAGVWIAVWESNATLNGTIGPDIDVLFARSTNDGMTWSAPTPLNNNASLDSGFDSHAQITTDDHGTWMAVWFSIDDLGGTIGHDRDILFARSTDNGLSWTTPAPVNTNAGGDANFDAFPQLTTDGMGTWLALWKSSDTLGGTIGSDFDFLFARSTDNGTTWTVPAPLNTNASTDTTVDDHSAQVATDRLGHWIAVWTSADDLGATIGKDDDILFSRFFLTPNDCNGNGVPDECDTASTTSKDCNGNAIPDECDLADGTSFDCQPNNVLDECDIADGTSEDCNGNGFPDECDIADGASSDCDINGRPDECETDSDGDGIIDDCDDCPADPNKVSPGVCGCGVADIDSDLDTLPDCVDQCPNDDDRRDVNRDGVPDCIAGTPVPALSAWGLIVLTLWLFIIAKIFFPGRRIDHCTRT